MEYVSLRKSKFWANCHKPIYIFCILIFANIVIWKLYINRIILVPRTAENGMSRKSLQSQAKSTSSDSRPMRNNSERNLTSVALFERNKKRQPTEGCTQNITLRNIPVNKLTRSSTLGEWPRYLHDYKNPCWYQIVADSNGLKCLPYFYVIGVGKSGTTSLYNQVIRHPDVLAPNRKEGIYFGENSIGPDRFLQYLEDFSRARKVIYDRGYGRGFHKEVTLDSNPNIFASTAHKWPDTEGREPTCTMAHTLYEVNFKVKIIVIWRNPVARTFSHYRQILRLHPEQLSAKYFDDKSVEAIALWEKCVSQKNLRTCAFQTSVHKQFHKMKVMLAQSLYYPYAREWLSVFPRDQIMFIKSEEFYADAVTVMKAVFDFLDLDSAPDHVLDDIREDMASWRQREEEMDKAGTSYRSMLWNNTRNLLDDFFAPYNKQLSQLLGDDKWLFK